MGVQLFDAVGADAVGYPFTDQCGNRVPNNDPFCICFFYPAADAADGQEGKGAAGGRS
jgi:hypothetical protein